METETEVDAKSDQNENEVEDEELKRLFDRNLQCSVSESEPSVSVVTKQQQNPSPDTIHQHAIALLKYLSSSPYHIWCGLNTSDDGYRFISVSALQSERSKIPHESETLIAQTYQCPIFWINPAQARARDQSETDKFDRNTKAEKAENAVSESLEQLSLFSDTLIFMILSFLFR